jgi:hypothetical protein
MAHMPVLPKNGEKTARRRRIIKLGADREREFKKPGGWPPWPKEPTQLAGKLVIIRASSHHIVERDGREGQKYSYDGLGDILVVLVRIQQQQGREYPGSLAAAGYVYACVCV